MPEYKAMRGDGTRFRIEIPISVRFCVLWLAAIVIAEAATVMWFANTDQSVQKNIIFGASLLGATVAIFSVLQASENIRRANYEKHIAAASRFLERWNDPGFADLKSGWRKLNLKVESMSGHDDITNLLENDLDSQMVVVEMLNFFEEIAIAIDTGAANEDLLKRYFRTIVVKAYKRYAEWLGVHRIHRRAPRYWIEAEAMMVRWSKD